MTNDDVSEPRKEVLKEEAEEDLDVPLSQLRKKVVFFYR